MLPQNPCLSLACWPSVCLLLLIGTPCVGQEEDTLGHARRLYWTGMYDEAGELYRSQLDGAPVLAVLGQAACMEAVGRSEAAREEIRNVIEDHPAAASLPARLCLAFGT